MGIKYQAGRFRSKENKGFGAAFPPQPGLTIRQGCNFITSPQAAWAGLICSRTRRKSSGWKGFCNTGRARCRSGMPRSP